MSERCCKTVFGGQACGKPAKFEHEGKRYCSIHYPPNVKARQDRNDAKWRAKRAADAWGYRIQDAKREIVRCAKDWYAAPEKDGTTADRLALAVAVLLDLEKGMPGVCR